MEPDTSDDDNGIVRYPGPRTLYPGLAKWLKLTLGATFATAVGLAMNANAAPFGIFVTAFFGICTIVGVTMLLPGSSVLRLDGNGFEITKFFFLKKTYRWRDVSDFVVLRISRNDAVVFKADKPRLGIYERISAAMAGGRNGYLPDTYGMAAGELVRLMTRWRNAAARASPDMASPDRAPPRPQ
jgi:hypothetical protein